MTQEGWREAILKAARDYERGDEEMLDLLTRLLVEQDSAKQALRELGYGVTGTPWPRVVEAIEAHGDRLAE